MRVRLTKRDVHILAKCAAARWLTTSQIQRLFFAGATPQAVRTRLRKLADEGYLRPWQEHHMAEMLHAVGPKGRAMLAEKGREVDPEKNPPRELEHFSGINDIRVAVELGGVRVVFFFAAWELGRVGWPYPIIPDAVFALDLGGEARFVAEYDRGTEGRGELLKKARAYERGLDGFSFNAVLILTDTVERLESLHRHLRRHTIVKDRFALGALADVRERGILSPVFRDLSARDRGGSLCGLQDLGVRGVPA